MKSINVFLSFVILITLLGCQNNKKWEYKVVTIAAEDYSRTSSGSMYSTNAIPKDSVLNVYGVEGWELTTSYLEVETAYPNFGDDKYVTGLQPNVRSQDVVLIFKRIAK